MIEFWLGVLTAAWLFTVGAVVYSIWKYVFLPWKVMRKDMIGLFEAIKQVQGDAQEALKLVQARGMNKLTDEEIAFAEKRMEARQRVNRPK